MVDFLGFWIRKNYGYMAACFAPMLQMKPVDVRESFQNKSITSYQLIRVSDVTAFISDIVVEVEKCKEKTKRKNYIRS